MKRFLVCTLVLAAVPMSLLNPMGRPAFLGYYLGVITLWAVFVISGQLAPRKSLTETDSAD